MFAVEMAAARDAIAVKAAKEFRALVVVEALKQLEKNTPKDSGFARSNWNIGTNPAGKRAPRKRRNQKYSSKNTKAGTLAALAKIPLASTVYLTNTVPYIEVLDQGLFNPPDPGPSKDPRPGRKGRILVRGGYSTQAPKGIVELSTIAVDMFVASKFNTIIK